MALIDNAYHQTKRLEAVMPEDVLAREPELLKEAAAAMPKIAFEDIDTLVVDQYGKEISGAGMDPNITGRFLFAPENIWKDIRIRKNRHSAYDGDEPRQRRGTWNSGLRLP